MYNKIVFCIMYKNKGLSAALQLKDNKNSGYLKVFLFLAVPVICSVQEVHAVGVITKLLGGIMDRL